jgi:hypothetical protein
MPRYLYTPQHQQSSLMHAGCGTVASAGGGQVGSPRNRIAVGRLHRLACLLPAPHMCARHQVCRASSMCWRMTPSTVTRS